jgi:hypothetical protein
MWGNAHDAFEKLFVEVRPCCFVVRGVLEKAFEDVFELNGFRGWKLAIYRVERSFTPELPEHPAFGCVLEAVENGGR